MIYWEGYIYTANVSVEVFCRCWREEGVRELNFLRGEVVGGCSCNIFEWFLIYGFIKLKLLV